MPEYRSGVAAPPTLKPGESLPIFILTDVDNNPGRLK